MLILILFAFLAGIITILSPCILPVLPIVLSGSVSGDRKRPYAIIAGFVASFTIFTLFLSGIISALSLPPNSVRLGSIFIVFLFGLVLLIPSLQTTFEIWSSKLPKFVHPGTAANRPGVWSGLLVGVSLGVLWTPCVGPIIASVIALAAAAKVSLTTFLITLSYSIGTAIPLLIIMKTGRSVLARYLLTKSRIIQHSFGLIMIATAVMLYFQVDRNFQTYVLTAFPAYGKGLTAVEEVPLVTDALRHIIGFQPQTEATGMPLDRQTSQYPQAPDFITGGDWFNSAPLTMVSLRGKVVLVDFWTYTCINCIRTLPYLKRWDQKYRNRGLVIVGIHTPEFAFEKQSDNVKKAVSDFGIQYPVMQDNNYATWNAYGNHYWPAEYLIDAQGRIRHTHFGEGNYDETEKTIIGLLDEAGYTLPADVHNPTYTIAASTPEIYIGYNRSAYFVSPERIVPDTSQKYSLPPDISPDHFALSGSWKIGAEYAAPAPGAALVVHYRAANVYMVARPLASGSSAPVQLELDGLPVSGSGPEVRNGVVTINAERLYTLIQSNTGGDHILKMVFPKGGIELYTLTFG